MFCPQCGAEYREGITVCAECQVSLVPVLEKDPRDTAEYVELEQILKTSDQGKIALAQSILENENIACSVEGSVMTQVGANPMRIMVPKHLAGQARKVLKDII